MVSSINNYTDNIDYQSLIEKSSTFSNSGSLINWTVRRISNSNPAIYRLIYYFNVKNYTVNEVRLVNKTVSLTWEQNSTNESVWALDDIEVILNHNNCNRTVLSENFDDMK